jgi:hypothetical protein
MQLVAPAFETRSMAKHQICVALCKAVRPGHMFWPKLRLTESGTDLFTILRCFLSFKTVVTL